MLLGIALPVRAESLIFNNFSQAVELSPRQDHYVVKGTGLRVQVAHRLVVGTADALGKEALLQWVPGVLRVTTLFDGLSSHFYLLDLNPQTSLQATLERLQQQPSVVLVQPDILQLTTRASGIADSELSRIPVSVSGMDEANLNSKGKGVKIAVIDDGFDLQHPRLRHVNLAFAYDTTRHQLSAQPVTKLDTHGTRVVGVLFASADVDGVAGLVPEADLIAIRQPDSWTSNTLLAFHLASLAQADIVNCSWHTAWLLEPVANAVKDLANHGRNGKGLPIVFAAGNHGREIAANSSEASIDAAIVVAAADELGRLLASSNYGPTIDIRMFGGAVGSTAVQDGYASIAGTSYASALVSGLAALMLAADPDLHIDALLQQLKQVSVQPKNPEALHAGL